MNLTSNSIPVLVDKTANNETIKQYIWGYSIKWFIIVVWAVPWALITGFFLDFSQFYWGLMEYYFIILLVFTLTNRDYYFLPITYITNGLFYIFSLNDRYITSTLLGFYKAMSWGILNIFFAIFMIICWNLKSHERAQKKISKSMLPTDFNISVLKKVGFLSAFLLVISILLLIFSYVASKPVSYNSNYEITFQNSSFNKIIRKELKLKEDSIAMRSDLDSIEGIAITSSNKIIVAKKYSYDPKKWDDKKMVFDFNSLIACDGNTYTLEEPMTNLKDIKHFRNLKYLEINSDNNLILYNLDDLLNFSKLETLNLSTSIYNKKSETNLSALKKLNTLKCLMLKSRKLTDLDIISDLDKLSTLRFTSDEEIDNIDAIKNLSNLTYLSIVDCNIKDIESISELDKLIYLSLYKNNVEDLNPIKKLNKLQYLDVRYNNITKLAPLEDLTNLKCVVLLENGEIKNIEPLTKLKNLKYLWINSSKHYDLNVFRNHKCLSLYTGTVDKKEKNDSKEKTDSNEKNDTQKK